MNKTFYWFVDLLKVFAFKLYMNYQELNIWLFVIINMIETTAVDSRSIFLFSGTHRMALSAFGSNYAGIEDLYGDYFSKYYLINSRY